MAARAAPLPADVDSRVLSWHGWVQRKAVSQAEGFGEQGLFLLLAVRLAAQVSSHGPGGRLDGSGYGA